MSQVLITLDLQARFSVGLVWDEGMEKEMKTTTLPGII